MNIALVNELAMLAHEMGIDLWEVIDGAATKPFGFQPFYPGIGPGGHCIPVDPYYLSWRAREFDFQTKFIELAADTNLRMASYVRERIQTFLNHRGKTLRGAKVLVCGAAFKAGVRDVRNSRALRLMELLDDLGAEVAFADPQVPSLRLGDRELKATTVTEESLRRFDLVVIAVAHREWPVDLIVGSGVPVFDAVNATRGHTAAHVERL